jgi:hypothetical protein
MRYEAEDNIDLEDRTGKVIDYSPEDCTTLEAHWFNLGYNKALKKEEELNKHIEGLEAMLFHFTGKME